MKLFNNSNRSFVIDDVVIKANSHTDVSDKKLAEKLLKMYPKELSDVAVGGVKVDNKEIDALKAENKELKAKLKEAEKSLEEATNPKKGK